MDGQSVFLLLVQILTAVSAEFCSEKLSVKLEGDVEEHGGNGSISHANVIYPKSTYWRKGSDVFGCPCQLEQKNCLPICSKGIKRAVFFYLYLSYANDFPSQITQRKQISRFQMLIFIWKFGMETTVRVSNYLSTFFQNLNLTAHKVSFLNRKILLMIPIEFWPMDCFISQT